MTDRDCQWCGRPNPCNCEEEVMGVTQVERNGRWEKALEEAYYPTIWEKIGHLFGRHIYPTTLFQQQYDYYKCLICRKMRTNL